MNRKNKNIYKLNSFLLAVFLSACGGSNYNNSSDTANENIIEKTHTTYAIEAMNEPYFKYLWHLDASKSVLNASYNINENADIHIFKAWELSKGEGVKVAVIDDGAEPSHEDLQENIILTYNADDANEKVFFASENASHGNTCAGFIASPINGKGIVGVAPKAKLIIIRQNEQSDAKAILAFEYAKNNAAKVISCSWGSNDVSEILVSELKKLYDAGITVVFASGNDGISLDKEGINDESEVEWVIGVGASGENNDITSYSNYGENIDILAPAGDTWTSLGVLGLDNMGTSGSRNQGNLVTNNYSFVDGTSFSTPITAGVIALMYAVNPNITPKEVREILIQTADKIASNDADYDNNGFDIQRAYGKINAEKAVLEAKKRL